MSRPHRHTIDHLPSDHWWQRVNKQAAIWVTKGVGTMWCAYVFALIAFSALPSVLHQHSVDLDVQWIAQTFLQLVLLSVIIVGQNIQSQASDARAEKTFEDTEAIIDRLSLETQGGLKDLYDKLHADMEGLKCGHG